ncbi:hypothetical protein KBY96_02130 [Cyanobium sp. ATX 6A2]|uniref:hypothetical protein n=1 Tax=Cyanobium sp. ATX 6A2 TaxID=2823700 RepID=UPI0020CFC2EF|nr:hypothetical protein [Cyanobium sp. ATX 6A2]MCP9886736.1 hypothetical protein [Cyanobium sp. ATX 6A2]
MLRSRQRGGGSLAERGYALAVALIASFVLLLGVAALASRGQLGFIGQAFQTQNRQARDVAEAGIAEFASVLNKEANRYMLIAGDDSSSVWSTTNPSVVNPCTGYNSDGSKISAGPSTPSSVDISRLRSGSVVTIDANRSYVVEEVEFLKEDRTPYTPSDVSYISTVQAGVNRPLIRVTVVGQFIGPGNRSSTSRISREFEVVPKCCKRSFGRNTIGGVNWGRDSRACEIAIGDNDGVIVGMNGGTNPNNACKDADAGICGSKNQKEIYDENCTLNADGTLGSGCQQVNQLLCWEGSSSAPDAGAQDCADGNVALGNPATTGISFVPAIFDFTFPTYSNPAGTPSPQYPTITIPNNATRHITYYNNGTDPAGIRICEVSGSTYTNCRRLDGVDPATAITPPPDPCYQVSGRDLDLTASPPRPYHTYNCQVQNIVLSNPGSTLRFDTTAAQINMLMYNTAYTGLYLGGAGSREISRVHCRTDLSAVPSGTASCGTTVTWDIFKEDCTLTGCEGIEYDVRRLLNVYANGTGSFDLNGTAAGVAFNLYAPFASVELRGGGGAVPNFMGRLWVDELYINGNAKIFTFSSGADGDGPGGGIPLVDFIARSFTQASGF